jgi:hypothetical protein
MTLTEEQKRIYQKKGKEYSHSKKGIESSLTYHRERIAQLEIEILKIRPKTPNGVFICDRCDVQSMAFAKEKRIIYRCEICGNEVEYNL